MPSIGEPIYYYAGPGAKDYTIVPWSGNTPAGLRPVPKEEFMEKAHPDILASPDIQKMLQLGYVSPLASQYQVGAPTISEQYYTPEYKAQQQAQTAGMVNIGTPERPLWVPSGSAAKTLAKSPAQYAQQYGQYGLPTPPVPPTLTSGLGKKIEGFPQSSAEMEEWQKKYTWDLATKSWYEKTPTAGTIAQPTAQQSYTVKSGDNLSKIAAQYGLSWQELYEANKQVIGANPNLIYPGQVFTIPGVQGPTAPGVQGPTAGQPQPLQGQIAAAVPTIETPSNFADYLKQNFGLDFDTIFKSYQSPQKSITDLVKEVMDAVGLPDATANIEKITKEIENLENERDGEIAKVNENPWLSEASRSKEVLKAQEKYEKKIVARTNQLRLYQSAYESAKQEAQYAATLATNLYTKEKDYLQEQTQWIMEQAEKAAETRRKAPETIAGGELMWDRTEQKWVPTGYAKPKAPEYREVQGGLYDVTNSRWIVEPEVGVEVTGQKKEIVSAINSAVDQYKLNPEGFREKFIRSLVSTYGEEHKDYISEQVYTLMPDIISEKQPIKPSAWEVDAGIWQWLATEGTGLSDEEKKQQIMQAGRNPESFGIY